ncbi:MAG: type II toxin-antitoxin system HicA family toxin [Spirochaetaceae bacterium]|jgi:predicted RNA binding protein YcfA (HicA-like mRNA interferase family)|nr:type II toxin-antitoxin system HicA family toxin [Spirochaetaceae bacterium]
MTFRDIERIIRKDGWVLMSIEGSHYHYKHASKTGKVTIPYHSGDIPKRVINSIMKQAGLK